ncbi:MAG: alanine--tRNA ligase-related protein [Oscillospiraceae bacterium]
METRKLYYEDPYLTRFSAAVVSCERAKDGFDIVLDQTAFYPEGGGQPCDRGALSGVQVTEVHEKDGVIRHRCAAALEAGTQVTGELDWARRFDHMQQHSGEHIFSGILHALTGFENVGFHMGSDCVTIDFSGEVSEELAQEVETRANRYIYSDAPVDIRVHPHEELQSLTYRSKKEIPGDVRIVTFPGADCCACCGTHVRSAGQVGLVKVLSCQKFREGSRLEILCGQRAFDYFSLLHRQNTAISQALSAKPKETAAAVERLKNELAAEKLRSAALEERLCALRAEALRGAGDVLLLEEDMSADSLRRLCVAVGESCGGRCAVFAGRDGGYKYAVRLESGGDERGFAKELNAALHGRGGGRDGFIQGSAAATEAEIRAFFGA